MNPFGHVDLRVDDIEAATAFYAELLPTLGFTSTCHGGRWLVWASDDDDRPGAGYFAVTEDAGHVPNMTRIAFWAPDRQAVDRAAAAAAAAGGRIESGPRLCPEYSSSYYAVYFEDRAGNRLEVYHRTD